MFDRHFQILHDALEQRLGSKHERSGSMHLHLDPVVAVEVDVVARDDACDNQDALIFGLPSEQFRNLL